MSHEEGATTQFVRVWLLQLANGDPKARDALLTHTRERLASVVRRQLRLKPGLAAVADVDDLLADAYVRLIEHWDRIVLLDGATIREPSAFFARATVVIKNVIADACRRYFGRTGQRPRVASLDAAARTDSDAPGIDPGSETLDPAALAEYTEFHQAVDALSPEAKAVFELRWYHGLTHEEVSAALNISFDASRRRWVEARLQLKKAIPNLRFDEI
jgi:RNA polymerase sigma factor (sigma-70 family)